MYRHYAEGYKRSVRKSFSALKDKIDHLPAMCHLFRRSAPSPDTDPDEWIFR